ncbi:MAG TPA: hypothetical protein VFG95_08750 [Nitrospiria bacterium]|nr:hypothetical protein [Nitrospiria bacterium]
MKGIPQDFFERYISELAYRRKPVGTGLQPHYYLETPHGVVAVDLASYEQSDKIPAQIFQAERRAAKYRDLKVPYVLVLWKGGGLPGLELRLIQETLSKQRPRVIGAVALLEGRPGHERMRVFHNPFTRDHMDKNIFDSPRDKHYYLLGAPARESFSWTAEETA